MKPTEHFLFICTSYIHAYLASALRSKPSFNIFLKFQK